MPAQSPLRAAVIGAGYIADVHLKCLAELPEADTQAVCDLSPATAEAMAERYAMPRWYTDSASMLAETQPDVVHITTPPSSHARLSLEALRAGAHVIVEKPLTPRWDESERLIANARDAPSLFVEDYSYVFSPGMQSILQLMESGRLGDVVHADVMLCSNIVAANSQYLDPNLPHPMLALPGGAIADFLPHLASTLYWLIGDHTATRSLWQRRWPGQHEYPDELRVTVEAERATGTIVFSGNALPETFQVRVLGTNLRATADLFESRVTVARSGGVPRPLLPFVNGLTESRDAAASAFGGFTKRLKGMPGSHEGLRELLVQTYRALVHGETPPMTIEHVRGVNRLIASITEVLPGP